MTFGERLATKRREKGWSQRALARYAGVSHTIIADLEKGARHAISTDAAKKLARALGVSVDYLIGTFEDAPAEEDNPALVGGSRGT
jgi:transcriptional regulator with XRE-family HTH domain